MASKIVYRVVTALLALCAFPAALFAPMVYVVGEVSLPESYVYDQFSLWDVYSLFLRKGSTFSGFGEGLKLTDGVRAVLPDLIASGGCLAAALILAVVIAGFAAFSNKKLVNLFLALAATGAVVALFVIFNGGFARPLTDGTISVADLGLIEWGIINSLLSAFLTLKGLKITTAGFLLIFIFVGVTLWTLAFVLTELGEPKKEAAKGKGKKK